MYADILFLSEFMNDYLILLAVSYLSGYSTKKKRVIYGAFGGAIISTMLAVFFYNLPHFINLIAGIILCFVMILITFGPETRNSFFRLFLLTYATAFIMGGISDFIRIRFPKMPAPLLFLSGYILFKIGCSFYLLMRKGSHICRINIEFCNEVKHFFALIDSGNLLYDDISCLPVSIINENELPHDFPRENTRTIAFNSLGCTNGKLEIINVPHMCIEYKGEKKLIENAPLGIAKHKLSSSDSYQMIISPDIINKMEM